MTNLIGCYFVGFVASLILASAVRFGFTVFAGSGRGSILKDIE